jgi:hypothetical protein
MKNGCAPARQCSFIYGAGTDLWLSRKLRELDKIRGQGRVHPMRARAVLVAPPASTAKAQFRTHSALVLVTA